MFTANSFTCADCGATLSESAMSALQHKLGNNCLFCRGTPTFHKNSTGGFRVVYNRISSFRDITVDAVFVEVNGICNPRFVVRLGDDYFNNRESAPLPDKFTLVRTRDGSVDLPCPIELVYYFDLSDAEDKPQFTKTINSVIHTLMEWMNSDPFTKG
jgi:hypothetical protein